MTIANVKNFAVGAVSAGYDAAATSIVMTTGEAAKLPPVPFYAIWWNATDYASPDLDPNREVVYASALATETYTIARAQEGTAAATHNTGGKSYRLLATVTAGQLAARSVTLASGGPTADVTTGISTWATLFTLPANFLAAGDLLRFHLMFHHKSGAYATAPRIGFQFAGIDIVPQATTYWAAIEFSALAQGSLSVQTIGAAAAAFRQGLVQRENGSLPVVTMDRRTTVDTTAALDLVANYRFDTGGTEVMNVGHWSVELLRS